MFFVNFVTTLVNLKKYANMLMILQLLIVLLALYVGSRYGSLALGAISGIGLAILVFCL